MSEQRNRTQEMISALKQQRDELALKIHLAEAEAKEEWGRLDDKLISSPISLILSKRRSVKRRRMSGRR